MNAITITVPLDWIEETTLTQEQLRQALRLGLQHNLAQTPAKGCGQRFWRLGPVPLNLSYHHQTLCRLSGGLNWRSFLLRAALYPSLSSLNERDIDDQSLRR